MWTGRFHNSWEGTRSDVGASDDGYSDEEFGSELEEVYGDISNLEAMELPPGFIEA